MAGEDPWAPLVERFVDRHYGSLRGQVRTYVIDRHLAAHLSPAPVAVLDVGGGAGNQSVPLARRGYDVTIVDSSPAMLERAAQLLAAEPPEVQARVSLVEAEAAAIPSALPGATFAGVLCHGVLPYVDDRAGLLTVLVGACAPGGIVSVVTKSRRTLAVRPAREGRWVEALAAFDADSEVNALGLETRADTIEELAADLSGHGVEPEAWYGVRLFADAVGDEDDPAGDLADVGPVELEASRRDPYRQMSRLFHYVGRKR